MSLGLKTMLYMLSGGSQHDPSEFIGKEISAARIEDNRLKLDFSDGVGIDIWDDGQSCCEDRYMRTDDDVQSLIGHKLTRLDIKTAPNIGDDEYSEHEVCFIEVGTDHGFITLANHNEHNGYYGGFGLTITLRDKGAEVKRAMAI